ncbi:MAG TPA: pirin family protein [Burkholderiales bacterium]|nr:pirin family protein [Burkholderiales bacterium]
MNRAASSVSDVIHDRNARGVTALGWLDSRHTFSFGSFMDPRRMGFRCLRVINDDRVIPGAGFGTHSHRDMEILTYVLEGSLEHKDSMGNGSIIKPGDVQIMSAGTGITHSEYNPSATDSMHFLQIWIAPSRNGLPPRYEQHSFMRAQLQNQMCLIGADEPKNGAVTIMQDVKLYACALSAGSTVSHVIDAQRYGFLQVARGVLELNGAELREGDGAQLVDRRDLKITTSVGAELLLFDLA